MLSFANRINNYLKQTAREKTGKLTARQRRRLDKKLAHQQANYPVNASGVVVEAKPVAVCPVCPSSGDQPCLTSTGNVAKQWHKARIA